MALISINAYILLGSSAGGKNPEDVGRYLWDRTDYFLHCKIAYFLEMLFIKFLICSSSNPL